MSAFIVEDKTINRIIFTFNAAMKDSWGTGARVLEPLRLLGYDVFGERLAKDMFKLNCESIEQHYGEGEAKTFRKLDYKFRIEPCSMLQGLKSLHCFTYQACEGDCDKTPLYLALSQIEDRLASFIVTRLPEYDKLEWG